MLNRRGFVFPLYIVMLTLLMCGTVIMLYLDHQEELNTSLVSPLLVLEARDDLEVFEMREKELIEGFPGDFDEDVFKEYFIGGITDEMKDFIFSDLIWQGKPVKESSDKDTFLENVLYAEVYEDSGKLVLKRTKVGKRLAIVSDGLADVSFPVEFEFEFEREYLISEDGSVEVVV